MKSKVTICKLPVTVIFFLFQIAVFHLLPAQNSGLQYSPSGQSSKEIVEVIIGTGDTTSGYIPLSPWYGYSFSQTIYLQSEIDQENKRINRIGFQYAEGTPEISEITEIWLGHTQLVQLDNTVQLGQSVKVFDGTFLFSTGEDFSWVDVDNFFYNNTDNLLVTVIEKKPGWNASSDAFYVTPNQPEQPIMVRFARNDSSPYDPNALPDGFGALERANIKLWMENISELPEIYTYPDSLHFGEVELTLSDTLLVYVQNVGGSPLEITGVNFSNPNFSLAGAAFPLMLETAEQQTFQVVFHPSVPQVENGMMTFLVDESVPGNKTVALSGRGLRFGILREGFEDELFPALGWEVIDNNNDGETWFRNVNTVPTGQVAPRTGVAAAGLPPYAGNIGQTSYDDWLISPKMVWEEGDLFEFWIKRLANQDGQLWRVQLSTTSNNISDFSPIDEIVDPPMTYTKKSYDLSQHGLSNGSQFYIAFQFNGVWCWPGVIDDVLGSVVVSYENDLMLLDLSGEDFVYQNEATEYEVFFGNYGTGNVSGDLYQIKLYAILNGQTEEVAAVSGVDINTGETKTIAIPVNFEILGEYDLYAEISWDDDENPANNTSDIISTEVVSNSIIIINIGTFPPNQETPYYYLYPVNFDDYRGESLHECLYYGNEMNTGGIVTRLTYYTSFAENIPNRKVKVWMVQTDMENLADSAIIASDMQLAFDGLLNFEAGIGKVDIHLTEPFVYAGGSNLAVMVYYYQGGNPYINNTSKFAYEYIENGPMRNVYDSWYTPIDPDNLQNVSRAANYPVTSLLFETGNGLGQLSGSVFYQDDMQPAEGTKIEIENADFPNAKAVIYSDASGTFLAPHAMAGQNLTVTISKYGYVDIIFDSLTLDAGASIALGDAYLETRPVVSLSGTVIKSDSQTAAGNADVQLFGIDNYQTTTAATGEFAFGEVWGLTDYLLEISLEGYQTFSTQIALGEVPLYLDTIILAEKAPSPQLLIATDMGDYAELNWYGAGDPFPTEFRYDDGVAVGVLITTGVPEIIGGSAWQQNAIVKQVHWYTYQSGSYPPSPTVMLTLLGLNPDGSPNPDDVLFVEQQVTNNYGWNTFELPQDIYAPNGFFFGTSGYSNYTLIAYDDGVGEPWLWQPETQWSNGMGSYFPLETVTAPPLFGNIFMRADGMVYESKQHNEFAGATGYLVKTDSKTDFIITEAIAPFAVGNPEMATSAIRSFEHYNIYRKKTDEEEWMLLNPEPVTDTTYHDSGWMTLEEGFYHYAVEAEYSNGVLSQKAISNDLYKLPTQITESLTEGVIIFPNPTTGLIGIHFERDIQQIVLIDHTGRQVYYGQPESKNPTLDLSELNNGIYFLQILTDRGTATHKIVKSH
jgi:hypothetical protein